MLTNVSDMLVGGRGDKYFFQIDSTVSFTQIILRALWICLENVLLIKDKYIFNGTHLLIKIALLVSSK